MTWADLEGVAFLDHMETMVARGEQSWNQLSHDGVRRVAEHHAFLGLRLRWDVTDDGVTVWW